MQVWVKYDLRASANGPPHRLRIAPSFVADHHPEGQPPGGEHPTLGRECGIDGLLRRIDLALVLPPRDRAVRIDHARGDLQAAIGHAFRAQYDRDVSSPGGIRDIAPRPFEERRIGRWHRRARPPVAGNEAFRKADHDRALSARLSDCRCRQKDGLLRRCRHAQVREGDANPAHGGAPSRRRSLTGRMRLIDESSAGARRARGPAPCKSTFCQNTFMGLVPAKHPVGLHSTRTGNQRTPRSLSGFSAA